MAWVKRALRLFRQPRLNRDIAAELQSHMDLRADFNRAAGMSAADARRDAGRRLGNDLALRERTRDADLLLWASELARNVRFALRLLRRNPGFAAIAVLTLALGIGANTAIFSVLDAVLLKGLPYPDVGRIVALQEAQRREMLNVSLPDYLDWRAQNRSFSQMAAYGPAGPGALAGPAGPETFQVNFATASLFPLLGAKPFLGRTFTEAEDKPGSPRLAVLGYAAWQTKLGGDRGIVGKTITLSGAAFRVIGVLPPGFQFLLLPTDVYTQLGPMIADAGYSDRSGHPGIRVLARLRPGVAIESARAQMATIMSRLALQYPKTNRNETTVVTPLRAMYLGGLQRVFWMLFGAAGLMLLLACVNVANLLLARASAHRKDFAVRMAVGAGRRRLLAQLLVESAVLALLGGGVGIGIAFTGMGPLVRMAPGSIPNLAAVGPDPMALLFTFLVAVGSVVGFGLAPAVQASRLDVNALLKENADATTSHAGQRQRSILLSAEIALAVVVLIGAGLLLRSLRATLAVDPGFDPANLLALKLDSNCGGGDACAQSFAQAALDRIRALPGVLSVALAMQPPLAGLMWTSHYAAAGQPMPPENDQPWTEMNMVTPGYFRTLGTPLLAGRAFTTADAAHGAPVTIINQTLARRLWPGQRVVGRRIHVMEAWREVIGVVRDAKQMGLAQPAWPEAFLPFAQEPVGFVTAMVRVGGDPGAWLGPVTRAVAGISPNQSVKPAALMANRLSASVEVQRFELAVLAGFAGLALLLAAIGVYGVTAYNLAQRTHEIGVRVALGASPGAVQWFMLKAAIGWIAAGLAAGLLGALGLTRLIAGLLFGVEPNDPLTFAAVVALLAVVALAACYLPARRAARVDPLVALRRE